MAAPETDPHETGGRPADRPAEGLDIFDRPAAADAEADVRSPRLGQVTLGLALLLLALDGLAVGLLAADAVTGAASIALVTMLASVVVGVVALVAVAMRRGRWLGVAAVLLAVLSNPFVFVFLLGRLLPQF